MRHLLLLFPLTLSPLAFAESPAAPVPPATTSQPDDPLSRLLAAITARKESLSLADFAPKDIPPETNAIPVFRKAGESLTLSPEDKNTIPDIRSLPLTGSQRDICDAALKSNAETLSLLARAAKLPNVDWQLPLDNPTLETFTNLPYGKMRDLANFARAAALRAHEQGNDSMALAHVREILALARALRQVPTLLSSLVATAIDATAAGTLHEITPDLAVGKTPGAATAAEVDSLARELTEDSALVTDHRRQVLGERALSYTLSDEDIGPLVKQHPEFDSRTLVAELLSITTYFVDAQNYPQSHKLWRDMEDSSYKILGDEDAIKKLGAENPTALAKLLLDTSILPSLDRSQLLFYRALADRRMAGIALALRRHAASHQNTLPEKLQTLLDEKLLTKIPDAPFGYLPTADRPRLYSISENGIDDAGSLAQPHPSIPLRRFLSADLPFFLTRPITEPPAPPVPPADRAPPPPF